ncbi:probable replication factor A 73 kDa subunit isoform X1 [Chenopodium quinoa]|uniref:Replication factor A C-terminal domain-containing protein n=1 Tax=Chenopodium quinoa TaxID=63459 RepID=A0A803MM83_CHEQI|nr:probable replication factor A 73 kDa subunit isoform X1 [Chenopodium quinoa]
MADQKYKTTRQKPEYVYLDQLNAACKTYIVRVVVAEKGRDTLSSKKTVRFQTLLLKDEKGNRMRGTLFGDQIEAFEEALQYLGEYDISAAPIKFIEEKWRTELDQFPYQMAFGSRTMIQPVHPELGPIMPNYQPIASIPRTVDPDEKYDIVGVVLYVEEEPRKIEARDGKRESFVREIVVTDESCDQPLTISLWNDLTAPKFFEKLPNWAEAFQVIGFRALKPYTRRGFSMNSGMSTRIIYKPEGDRARELSDWANLFHQKILDRQTRVLEVKYPGENKKIVSIAELRRKKPSNTIQEELLWIEVTIQNAELEKVHAYTGCSNCWKRTNLPLQKHYSCTSCYKKECICTERTTFKFEASDGTGTMAFTNFNDDTERLFRRSAAETYAIKEADDHNAFEAIQDMLRSKPFYIKVGPTSHLGQNNVLEWNLKGIGT